MGEAADSTDVATLRDEYLQKVRSRLSETKELDRREAKDRIQEKHKKRKLKAKGGEETTRSNNQEGGDGDGDVVVTLGGPPSDNEDSGSEEESDSSEGTVGETDEEHRNVESMYEDSDDQDNADS